MRSFDRLISLLSEVPDPRRREGKLYQLPYVLLFSILAVVTGGNSYRSIETFITVHRCRLNAVFGLRWKRAPAHTAIRYILQGLDPKAVEQAFRRHAAGLLDGAVGASQRTIARDGKVLRRSFDNFTDRKAAQLLHAFDTKAAWSWRISISTTKSSEIPAAQQLLGELQVRAQHHHPRCSALPKKTFEAAAPARAGMPLSSKKDNRFTPAAKCRNRLRIPPSHQQRHLDHHRAQSP